VTDMATIRRRGRSWHVQVRRQRLPALTRSFSRRSDAELWARQRETEIDRGNLPVNPRELRSHTLRHVRPLEPSRITNNCPNHIGHRAHHNIHHNRARADN